MPILEVENLRCRYKAGGPEVLKGVSFSLEQDDFLAIVGPSGAGKSTLIRCINRLVEPSEGKVVFEGKDLTKLNYRELLLTRRRIGMIFQEFNLVERMKVIENVLTGTLGTMSTMKSVFKMWPKDKIAKAIELLRKVELGNFLESRADQLSGGQRQRVGIARALIQSPHLLLVDEPTSSLDPKISRDVMAMIRDIAREARIPVLCNIHDEDLAVEFGTKAIGISSGNKVFDGPTSDLNSNVLEEIYAREVL